MTGFYCDTRLLGTPRYVLTDTPESLMDLPPEISKCVAFVGYKDNVGIHHFAGTAFFVSRPFESGKAAFVYILTAKHVIDNIRDKRADKVCLRVNLKEGRAVWLETDIEKWRTHPDQELGPDVVDVAVFQASFPSALDHVTIPVSMFASDETIISKIKVGLEIFLAGLFSNHSGQRKNIPVIRVGNVIALPEEQVQTKIGLMDAYLVEARSFGGISGSPVFVGFQGLATQNTAGGASIGISSSYSLLGLMHGHWTLDDDDMSDALIDTQSEKQVNLGIAIVVPATKILEVMEQPMIKKQEKEIEENARKQNLPQMDSLPEPEGISQESFEDALKRASRKVSEPETEKKVTKSLRLNLYDDHR